MMQLQFTLLFLVLAAWFGLNVRLSYELIVWTPDGWGRKVLWLAFVWLVPVIGFVVTYRSLALQWFGKRPANSGGAAASGGGGAVGGSLLEVDAVFNPGAQHLAEAKRKPVAEMQQEGEPDRRDFSEISLSARPRLKEPE